MKIVLWLLNCLWIKLGVMLLAVFVNYFAVVRAFRKSRSSKLRKMIFHLFISCLVHYCRVWIWGVFVLGVTYVDFEMDFLPKVVRTGQEFSIQGKFKLLQSSPPSPPPPTLKNVHPDKRICIKGGDSQLCHLYMGGSIKLGNPGSRFQ